MNYVDGKKSSEKGTTLFRWLFYNIFMLHYCAVCANIPSMRNNCTLQTNTEIHMSGWNEQRKGQKHMAEESKYYVVRQKALPEVLLKVAQVNRLIETKGVSVADATEQLGISRSSYYKYKDDIFPFRDNVKGKTITFVLSMDDEPGLLSAVLSKIATFKANILTIHQTIPVNGIASLTLSVDILPTTGDSAIMLEEIEALDGVRYLKILSRE